LNIAGGLDKPVFAALSHFELTTDPHQDFRAQAYPSAGTASTVANAPHSRVRPSAHDRPRPSVEVSGKRS
jgi:hypothetical protein